MNNIQRFSILLMATITTHAYPHIKNITFMRECMSHDETGRKVEGYWATSPDLLKDRYKGKYPFPQANTASWNDKEVFIKKLYAVEKYAAAHKDRFKIIVYRGLSSSRLNDEFVGNEEFHDTCTNIAWPRGLCHHYFDTFNVMPSREFYDYIMNF